MSQASINQKTVKPSIECHIEVKTEGVKATSLLAENSGLTIAQIKDAMQKGAVWLSPAKQSKGKQTKRLRRASAKVEIGQTLHLYYNPDVLNQICPTPQLIADEGDYSVWFKPFGMLSQGSKWSDHCTLARWVELNHAPQRPSFVVHRLDKATSGIMLISHGKKAANQLAQLFRDRNLTKQYQAIVETQKALVFDQLFLEQIRSSCRQYIRIQENACIIEIPLEEKKAYSRVKILKQSEGRALLEIDIKTGRKHQIRQHLAAIGLPIVGDRLHGNANEKTREDLQLSASYLAFISPFDGREKNYVLPELLCIKLQN